MESLWQYEGEAVVTLMTMMVVVMTMIQRCIYCVWLSCDVQSLPMLDHMSGPVV